MSLKIIQKVCLEVTATQRRTKGQRMFFSDVERRKRDGDGQYSEYLWQRNQM